MSGRGKAAALPGAAAGWRWVGPMETLRRISDRVAEGRPGAYMRVGAGDVDSLGSDEVWAQLGAAAGRDGGWLLMLGLEGAGCPGRDAGGGEAADCAGEGGDGGGGGGECGDGDLDMERGDESDGTGRRSVARDARGDMRIYTFTHMHTHTHTHIHTHTRARARASAQRHKARGLSK